MTRRSLSAEISVYSDLTPCSGDREAFAASLCPELSRLQT